MRHAAIEFRSERYMRIDGKPPASAWDKIAGVYRTGRRPVVRLHTNFPHHRDGMLKLLGCTYEREAVQAALAEVGGREIRNGGRRGRARRHHDALARRMGGASAGQAPWRSCRCSRSAGSARRRPGRCRPTGERPLSGIRVLDLTRVIAGPVCGRTLAAHGADVMRITAPHLPGLPELDIDTGRGKLSASLDLRADEERERLARLLREAPHLRAGLPARRARRARLLARGAAPRSRPGIVAVSLSAYGHDGPWAARRGFDSLVQTASGINHAEAEAAGVSAPKELPAQALDHATGYLMAFGAMMALARKARRAARGTCACRWRRPAIGSTGWAACENGFDLSRSEARDVADLLDQMRHAARPPDLRAARRAALRDAGLLGPTARQLGTHAPVWPI